jgi:leader peptidase (prepilin peptidase)/N-methyltransferase
MPDLAFMALVTVLGLIVGSFLNVVIYRLPVMLDRDWRRQCRELSSPDAPAEDDAEPFNLARPGSACPACRTPIKPWHNVPVLSWLWLRGRCAACGAGISVRYPLVEAATGVASALVALRFGATLECAGALLLCWSLIALSGIDLDHQLLPDAITLPLLWLGLAFALLGDGSARFTVLADLESAVLGAILGYLSLWTVYHAFRLVTGKEGMGYGDFKLLAALGAWLGWQALPVIVLLSAFVGALTGITLIVARGRDRQLPIPFGPFLAVAGFVTLLWGDRLVASYRDFSGL